VRRPWRPGPPPRGFGCRKCTPCRRLHANRFDRLASGHDSGSS
jgi:hypothetical protein